MSEFDALMSKSKEDLEVIAASFGDYTPNVAKTKSREELIASITRMPVQEVVRMIGEYKSVAPAAEKEMKESAASAEASKEEEAAPEAPPKRKRGRPRKNPIPETAPAAVASALPAEDKSAKAGPAEVTDDNQKSDVKAEITAEQAAFAAPKKRGRKKKVVEPSSEEVKESEDVEIALAEVFPVPETAAASGTASESGASISDETRTQVVSESRIKKRRRISFGPDSETKEIEITDSEGRPEESGSENSSAAVQEPQYIEVDGILEIGGGDGKNDYNGFIHRRNYLPGEDDSYVPGQMIRKLGLRKGDHIKGLAVAPHGKDRYAPLRKVLEVNGIEIPDGSDFEVTRKRPRFESLTAIYPDSRLRLETGSEDLSCRIIDLFCPIGKGQRGMIVSPPKAGKTVLLKKVANAITTNNPECKVIVLLIDERPEEVTDMQRSIKGEVVYSTFDKRPENHVRVTELVLERAMRLVELGQDVVILLDSMTRLARAYNLTINPTGRTLSGGLDPGSLYGPKRFFGAARNIEFGGSLTIIASALIETGSRMDEVIFEEFKGTGNMEVVLDRKLADRRVYPAIAVDKSGTRREDLLLTEEQLASVWLTRKAIADVDTIAGTEAVLNFLKRTPDNRSFVISAQKSFQVD